MKDYLVPLAILGAGLILVYQGVSGLLGYRRRAYILWYYYAHYAGLINYGSIPLGIMGIMWGMVGLVSLPSNWLSVALWTSILFGLTGVLFGVFQPRFLMPKWYRWLKTNHGDIIPWLREDVERIGYDVWRNRTNTQEGLEAWVAEVRRKYGWDHPDAKNPHP